MESRIFAIRITVLDLVGILGDVSLYFWEASQEEFRFGIEFAKGFKNDRIGDLHVAT